MAERFEVTLKPLFEARVSRRPYALSLEYAFQTTDGGEMVYAFDRSALRAAQYSEDLNSPAPDVRNAFTRPGWYTLGRNRKATVERNDRGYLRLVSLERANTKATVTE
jgi:hypothetical protein